MPRGKIKTHQDWLTCNEPGPLYTVIGRQSHSMRKYRLLACAAARRAWAVLDDQFRLGVEMAEKFADGEMSKVAFARSVAGLRPAIEKIFHSVDGSMKAARLTAPYIALQCATEPDDDALAPRLAMDRVCMMAPRAQSWPWQCGVLRDIFRSPFHTATVDPSSWPGTVVALAQALYAEYSFDRMPILADALEDAGCTNQDLLEHCRGDGEHVRGCWVIDLLTGRQ